MAIKRLLGRVAAELREDLNQRYLLIGQLAKLEAAEAAEVLVCCPYPKDPSRSIEVEQWAVAPKLVSTILEKLVLQAIHHYHHLNHCCLTLMRRCLQTEPL